MLDSKRRQGAETGVTIIGQGTRINGEIHCQGTMRIEGHVAGRVQCDDTIMVLETGRVEADLVAKQIVISGEVKGNVFAHERLEIMENGKLLGDITAPRLAIAEGVLFEGKCSMKAPGQARPQEPAKAAAR
jgi:cytoskeletal protein CcmA (bactofilin family)